jgi:sugar lactone lactonase YvrE
MWKPSLALLACLALGCTHEIVRDEPSAIVGEPAAAAGPLEAGAPAAALPPSSPPSLQPALSIHGPMPTGIAISKSGRIFVAFPRRDGRPVQASVAELMQDQLRGIFERDEYGRPQDPFISAESLVIDSRDRLWILDSGSFGLAPPQPGAAKLVAIDVASGGTLDKIVFPKNVVLPTSWLKDLRIDLRRGQSGTAYISDAADHGPNAIIVVDLASGRSWRRLHGTRVVSADPELVPIVESKPLLLRRRGAQPEAAGGGVDGIELSTDGKYLYWTPRASNVLYRVRTSFLADRHISDAVLLGGVESRERDFASNGLAIDRHGRLYLTDYEGASILRLPRWDERFELLVADRRLVFPDRMAFGPDGYLYLTASQDDRSPRFHEGADLRRKPFHVYRVFVGGRAPLAQEASPGPERDADLEPVTGAAPRWMQPATVASSSHPR